MQSKGTNTVSNEQRIELVETALDPVKVLPAVGQ
jgi:hypothetical protein